MSQFSAIRFIDNDSTFATTSALENVDSNIDDCDDDDDGSGFVDVPLIGAPSDQLAISREEREPEATETDKILSRPLALLTDKLPWEMEGNPTSSMSKSLQSSHSTRAVRLSK